MATACNLLTAASIFAHWKAGDAAILLSHKRSNRRLPLELIGPPKTGFPNLYHYQAFNVDRLRQAIVEKRLYFSNPARFNDPWDCQPYFNSNAAFDPSLREKHVQYYIRITRKHGANATPVSEDQIQRRAQQLRDDPNFLNSKIHEFSRDFSKQIARCWRVYCISTHPDSELMWAHYAASHHGVCLEFTSRSSLFFQALKVRYVREYPVFDMAEEDNTLELMVLLTKSKAWEYEDEYRLIAMEKACATAGAPAPRLASDNGLIELPDGSLKSVIMGHLADTATIDAVKAVINQAPYPIALKRVVKVPNEYKLRIANVT